ncbi:(4Fe-4S)-binding protein [Granulicoccus phenolivorans]|uniref:(4Fe-4S)-binding protein n=1 Tax=Granulicoccus phenolivorans TaxID=266854 RepID=UPI00047B5470|nr:(4Fe-4S)-binding protein [Granulicoccus phenolivorans]
MTRKHYRGPLVDVTDERALCIHSTECVRGMPAVFDTGRRPWIDPTAADTPDLAEQLREVVARCPSGALQISEHPADH